MSTSPVAAHSPRVALEGSIQNAAHSPRPAGTLILASIRPVRKLIGDFDLILDDVYHLSSTGSASRSAWFCFSSIDMVSVFDIIHVSAEHEKEKAGFTLLGRQKKRRNSEGISSRLEGIFVSCCCPHINSLTKESVVTQRCISGTR